MYITYLVCDFAAMEYEEFNILRFVEVRSKQVLAKVKTYHQHFV